MIIARTHVLLKLTFQHAFVIMALDLATFQWAESWENISKLRKRVLRNQKLLIWPSKETVGVENLQAIGMNRLVMEVVAEDWCQRLGPRSKRTLQMKICKHQARIPWDLWRDVFMKIPCIGSTTLH